MRKNDTVIKDIIEINRRLCYDLWNISDVTRLPTGLSPRLIVPTKRNKEIRISEQESRFLYCSLLNSLNYFYSVETPTEKVYKQTGQKYRSASSDLSLYSIKNKGLEKAANVEFKVHNSAPEHIRKDIEKLMKEDVPGNWFHTLKNIDGRTLQRLFGKIAKSLKECRKNEGCDNVSIVFCLCVLDKKWACLNHFLYSESSGDFGEYVDGFFNLSYSVKTGKILVADNAAQWEIYEMKR